MKKKSIFIFLAVMLVFIASSILGKESRDLRDVKILIDAGHGGSDPGTVGIYGSYEKDLNLEIATKLERALADRGYRVVMTREKDSSLTSMARARMANDQVVDLVISIHCNAAENKEEIEGLQVLYYPSEESRRVAGLLLENILKVAGMEDLGIVERRDLIVLNQSRMPAIIVETGFLSNRRESEKLNRGSYQRKIVKGIVKGVDEYFYSLGR